MAANHYDSIRERTRNFCIVAHIDHGKSTLADRMIERTGLLTSREMQDQVLDNIVRQSVLFIRQKMGWNTSLI